MMVSRFHLPSLSRFQTVPSDHTIPASIISSSLSSSSSFLSPPSLHAFRMCCTHSRARQPSLICCKASRGSSSVGDHADDLNFLPASLLLPETLSHHRMRRQGFLDEMTWQSYSKLFPSSLQGRGLTRADPGTLGIEFLRRFKNPTIFLRISCDGDFLLPISVGEFAVDKLLDALPGDNCGGCPDHFQVVKNIVGKLDHEVKMVRITERIVNTYISRLYIGKPGENDMLSLDARPSDALSLADRCKAPIYVRRQIVISDAIKIGHGMGRPRDSRPAYDVSLDRYQGAFEVAFIKSQNEASCYVSAGIVCYIIVEVMKYICRNNPVMR
ncbi:Bifunctional nuclease 2 [Linum grandiflorum]